MSDSKPFKPGYIEDRIIKDSINVNHDDRISEQKVRLLNPENEFAGKFLSCNLEGAVIKGSFLDDCKFNTICGYVQLSDEYENVKNISSDLNDLSIWTRRKTNNLQDQITNISVDLSGLTDEFTDLSIYTYQEIATVKDRVTVNEKDIDYLK